MGVPLSVFSSGPGSKKRQRHPSAGGMKDKDSEIEGISVN